MGAKKIKKKRAFVPDVARVNRAFRAIVDSPSIDAPVDAAPVPEWELNYALPSADDPDAPIPAIKAELVDYVVIIKDSHLVADFEAAGIRMARLLNSDQERVLLWLIDKSRDLDRRKIDDEFAIDMGPEIRNRTFGGILACLAKKGLLRIIATSDRRTVIVQFIVKPEDYDNPEVAKWIDYWTNRKQQ